MLIIKAAITPGIQPKTVKIKTITKEPQPLSITANGGKTMHNKTRKQPIKNIFSKVIKIILQYNVNIFTIVVIKLYFCFKC